MILGPRVVIAGTHSGVGKTTIATGLMAAMVRSGLRVAPAKVGPDFIDPGYHALATGRPGRNLDAWMCGPELMAPLAASAGFGADVLVIEGVMGLFDGAADGSPSSTADIARLIDAPVILVVDCASQAGSVAALVHGFATFDPTVRLAGVILNRLGSAGHESMVRNGLAVLSPPIPVVGALHRDDRLAWRDRHLGLIPVAEAPVEVAASLAVLTELIAGSCDLNAIEAIAHSAPPMRSEGLVQPGHQGRTRIAVASGPAFTFSYPDNAEFLAAAGAEIVEFDPLRDVALPAEIGGLVIGGGFPEMMVEQLSANQPLMVEVARRVGEGLVTWAECGGLLWLARSLDERALVGSVATKAAMTDRLTLGYRHATCRVDTPLGLRGTQFRGHEFHYSTVEPAGDALELTGRHGCSSGGFGTPTLLATYVHTHLAGRPDLAENFVARACSPVDQTR